jgi:hypothetical protein
MKTPLIKVEILSIYTLHGERVLLPARLALVTPDMHRAITGIEKDIIQKGGRLVLSDLYRSYDMQMQAYLDHRNGKKSAYSPPPGGSMHESGRAFDLSLEDIKISLSDFWKMAKPYGIKPIISSPDKRKNEAWHFDCRGSHGIVYDYYAKGKGTNMKPYEAMAASGILAVGQKVDRFGEKQAEAYFQSCLVRLGYQLGNVDGLIGRKTKKAVKDAGIDGHDITESISIVEDKLQEKYPEEYSLSKPMGNIYFDVDVPEGVVG